MPKSEKFQQLPAPWDRIFSLFTRLFVWALLIAVLYLLRPFFLLIFLTFVFAYIQNHGVEGLAHRFKNRAYRVTLVFVIFLGVIVGTFYFLAPHVRNQMAEFGLKHETYMDQADDAIYRTIDSTPALKRFLEGQATDKEGKDEKDGEGKDGDPKEPEQDPKPEPKKPEDRPPIVRPFVLGLLGLGGDDGEKKNLEQSFSAFQAIVGGLVGITSSFLLSILFSFLIVLDLPKLSRSVQGLAKTRLDFIYEEAADNIYQFAKRLGRALEAQLFIAVLNTIFTAIGVYFLGLPSIVFLSTIVFFCSFIPVAGVFLSSAPICLLALQTGGDNAVRLMLFSIGFIVIIHMIEAYILNPKIYGHHLRMNSVLVLIVLTIAGKIVGVWGLVLGIPVVNYIFVTAIRKKPGEDEDDEDGGGAEIPVAPA
jgi:predicted PurR-regulated permease PerM